MKTINFYKKEKLIFSVYADELDDVLAKPQDYFSGYSTDMIITDVKYEYPIFKDDRLREMTKEEKVRNNIPVQLVDGEFIKDVCNSLKQQLLNVETVLEKKLDEYAAVLASSLTTSFKVRIRPNPNHW